jgi:hypothetical protein
MERDDLVVQQVARHAQAEPFVEPVESFGFNIGG